MLTFSTIIFTRDPEQKWSESDQSITWSGQRLVGPDRANHRKVIKIQEEILSGQVAGTVWRVCTCRLGRNGVLGCMQIVHGRPSQSLSHASDQACTCTTSARVLGYWLADNPWTSYWSMLKSIYSVDIYG
jgi:hypothetical protein